jgi:hypothetical protein
MNTISRIWQVALIVGIVGGLVLLAFKVKKEFQEAIKKDEDEKTGKHLKRVLLTWGIVLGTGLVVGVVVFYLRGEGFLNTIREFLYGKSVPVVNPWGGN